MPAIRDRSVVRSSVIPSAKYCCSRSSLRLAKGSTTIDKRGAIRGATELAAATGDVDGFITGQIPQAVTAMTSAATAAVAMAARTVVRRRGDTIGTRDVFDALLAHILERVGQLVADLVSHHSRNADPTGIGERLQPRGNI